jgi:hypothetical protein
VESSGFRLENDRLCHKSGIETREKTKAQRRFSQGLAKTYEKVYLRISNYCSSLEPNGKRHETPEGVCPEWLLRFRSLFGDVLFQRYISISTKAFCYRCLVAITWLSL